MHFQRDNTLILPVNCDILHVMFSFLNFSLTADGWPSGENQERVNTSVIPELKIGGFLFTLLRQTNTPLLNVTYSSGGVMKPLMC